jgi:ribosomal subunit interface protein
MDIRVSGHQVEVGEGLRSHADEHLRAADAKYRARIVSAQITFGKGPHDHGFTCEIVAYAPQGLVFKATDRAADAHRAFDSVLDKVATQIRRTTRQQKDHHGAPELAAAPAEMASPGERRGGL